MNSYVLAFAFDDLGRVALIKKARPEWQQGKWNGVGGKIEDFDAYPSEAMSREFEEETGVRISDREWKYAGRMDGYLGPQGLCFKEWEVLIFTIKSKLVRDVKQMTDEHVHLYPCWAVPINSLDNVRALVQLCQLGDVSSFALEYRRENERCPGDTVIRPELSAS